MFGKKFHTLLSTHDVVPSIYKIKVQVFSTLLTKNQVKPKEMFSTSYYWNCLYFLSYLYFIIFCTIGTNIFYNNCCKTDYLQYLFFHFDEGWWQNRLFISSPGILDTPPLMMIVFVVLQVRDRSVSLGSLQQHLGSPGELSRVLRPGAHGRSGLWLGRQRLPQHLPDETAHLRVTFSPTLVL